MKGLSFVNINAWGKMPVDDTGKRDDECDECESECERVEKWAYEKDIVIMCDLIFLYQ